MWKNIVSLIMGIWMVVSPSLLVYSKNGAANAYISGAIILTFSIISFFGTVKDLRWVTFLAGLWLIISHWIPELENSTFLINNLIVGFIVVILSAMKRKVKEQYGGGWSEIFKSQIDGESSKEEYR